MGLCSSRIGAKGITKWDHSDFFAKYWNSRRGGDLLNRGERGRRGGDCFKGVMTPPIEKPEGGTKGFKPVCQLSSLGKRGSIKGKPERILSISSKATGRGEGWV